MPSIPYSNNGQTPFQQLLGYNYDILHIGQH